GRDQFLQQPDAGVFEPQGRLAYGCAGVSGRIAIDHVTHIFAMKLRTSLARLRIWARTLSRALAGSPERNASMIWMCSSVSGRNRAGRPESSNSRVVTRKFRITFAITSLPHASAI